MEISCIASMEEDGSLIRLYPVPFRLLSDNRQFRKWQWVSARIEKAKNDHRSESHKVFVDTIKCDPLPLSTKNDWRERLDVLAKVHIFSDFSELDTARKARGLTLGFVRPLEILGLEITASDRSDWTDAEKEKLIHLQQQPNLFDDADTKSIAMLRKLPFDFHYRYICGAGNGPIEYRHKIVDWEVGSLYWNVRRSHGDDWEAPFRNKIEKTLPARDLIFLMGTIHRFPDQWLIVSLIYPPRQPLEQKHQGSLL